MTIAAVSVAYLTWSHGASAARTPIAAAASRSPLPVAAGSVRATSTNEPKARAAASEDGNT